MYLCYDVVMNIPVGFTYYSVSEEIWFNGPDAVDRDFETILETTDFAEALVAIATAKTTNRFYLDLMTQRAGGAGGSVIWSGYQCEICIFLFSLFDAAPTNLST